MQRHRSIAVALLVALLAAVPAKAQLTVPTTGGIAAITQARRMLGHNIRVLVIGAHPDDEDTELLALVSRGLGGEAAYLSLNRGEGGQNAIGPELGDAMGVLRTEELLAAREVDGARQYFTRGYDFGFSKTLDDTWRQWPRDSILKDAVRVIRSFQPQVVVTVFSGTPRDGHGQHQAAGWIAREAFRVAGDSTRFPELQRELGLAPWTPAKLYRGTRFDPASTTTTLDGGAVDPVAGKTYHQIAMDSRSHHRSQDMGQLQAIGSSAIRLQLIEDRTGRGATGLLAGIDTSLSSPSISAAVRADQSRHDAALRLALAGVLVDGIADDDRLVPGTPLRVTVSAANLPADAQRVQLGIVDQPGLQVMPADTMTRAGAVASRTFTVAIAALPAWAQPYFLRAPRDGSLYRWPAADASDALPFEPQPLRAMIKVTLADGTELPIEREITFRENLRTGGGERRRPIAIMPAVSISPEVTSAVWPIAAARHQVRVVVRHHAATPWRGTIQLEVPRGWVAPAAIPLTLSLRDERQVVTFDVARPTDAKPGTFDLQPVAVAESGARSTIAIQQVAYDHVRPRAWTVPSALQLSLTPLVLPAVRVGYVRGTADRIPEALRAAGLDVTEIDSAMLAAGMFTSFDAIAIGPRAFERVPTLRAASAPLKRFADAGGVVIIQYQNAGLVESGILPFPLALSGDRVTEEDAAVTIRDSTAAVLRVPNRIGASDWDGWVQERGLQFAGVRDGQWIAPLEMHDIGEPAHDGSLVVARTGKGAMVYTGISFFRQLPVGVSGAMRLFVNLLALGARH